MYDDDGKFLSKEELLELIKTKEGKKLVQKYLLRARIAFTAQSLFEAMSLIPDDEMQTLVCEVIERNPSAISGNALAKGYPTK